MPEGNIDQLLKARLEIDAELRRYKTTQAILFTDVVGSTTYFDRFGDTAGLLFLHRHDRLVIGVVEEFQGTVIKTIGDSVMAEFPEPLFAVRAAVEIQQRLFQHNQSLADTDRLQIRIGVNSGVGFRRGNDLFGETVNVAARITKRSQPSQILVSQSVYEATRDTEICCKSLGSATLEGKAEREPLYEVIWSDDPAVQKDAASQVETPEPRGDSAIAPEPVSPRYEILDRVGAGGMGVVFKARDRETGEVVALKVLKPEIADLATSLEGLKNELRLARKITHKNVCRIHDFNRDASGTFISMEFVEGESLRRVLNRFNALSARQGIKFAQQICEGLREAHAQGIVHRDIKPENLMIDASGNVKLMDFGLAQLVAEGSSGTVGTPAYMAPEQAQGTEVDQRADIYALGLVLFEIFTGSAAFTADTPIEVALKQIREAPPKPRDIEQAIPEHIERAILRCLEKDPAKRFQSVEELQAAFVDEPAPTTETFRRRQADRAIASLRRFPLWAVPGLAVLIVFVAATPARFNRMTETKHDAVHRATAVTPAEVAAFRMAQSLDAEEAWNTFIRNYPEGPLVSAALERLVKLQAEHQEELKTPLSPAANPSLDRQPAVQKTSAGGRDTKPAPKWTAFFDMVDIPAGTFMMGSDEAREDEKPRHEVKLSAFRMGRTEITNRQYLAFLEDTGLQRPKDPAFSRNYLQAYPDLPVVNVTYQDAVAFCKWVSTKLGMAVRLPTEAEWEYAARGRQTDSIYPWGSANPQNFARYKGNLPRGVMTARKDQYPANGFGLYNMSGNVWEWVSDFYSRNYYQISPVKNPSGPEQGVKRVIRGGSWADDETQLRSARRGSHDSNDRSDRIGFRIVASAQSAVSRNRGPKSFTASGAMAKFGN